jgi:transposase
MIELVAGRRVFACARPTDLRKGYDALAALVEHEMGGSPLSGELYLFVSRNRERAKVLYWDGSGLCILMKRLERGRFACLWRRREGELVKLSRAELALFLEGSEVVGRKRLVPEEMSRRDLAIAAQM